MRPLALASRAKDSARTHDFSLLRRRCGVLTAQASWLVLVSLAEAQLVLPDEVLVFTPTRRGWRVAYET